MTPEQKRKLNEVKYILRTPYKSESRPGKPIEERQIFDSRQIEKAIGLLADLELEDDWEENKEGE